MTLAALVSAGCSKPADKPVETAAPANEVEIVATDYAFRAPATIRPGVVNFRFSNDGKSRHELSISRLKPGVSIDQFVRNVREDKTVRPLIVGPVGVLFAEPGGKSNSGLAVDVLPGESYAIICSFRDSTGAKAHFEMGMYGVIKAEGETLASPAIPTDPSVATDYAFRYPGSINPGMQAFVMKNDGKQRHEMNFLLLKKGVTLQKLLETDKAGGNVDELFDGDLGLLHSYGGTNPLGQLTIDMLPDRDYVIACFFQDTPKSPEHYKLGMFGSIHTTPQKST
jgi:hypothetical protein